AQVDGRSFRVVDMYTPPDPGSTFVVGGPIGWANDSEVVAFTQGSDGDKTWVFRDTAREQRTGSGPIESASNSLLPGVTPVDTPAGNRVWRIKGLAGFTMSVSPGGRYLVGLADDIEGQNHRVGTVAVNLQSGAVRLLATHVFGVDDGAASSIAGSHPPVGWVDETTAFFLTDRQSADDPANTALSLLKIDLATGKRVIDFPVPIWDGLFTLSPSPDGWSVAHEDFGPKGNRIVYWLNLRTGEDHAVSPPDLYAQGAMWAPDSSRLAFGASPLHADGYPVLTQTDSSLLLPDTVEVVDLPALTRRQFSLPRVPALVGAMGNFREMLVSRVDVINDPQTADGWRLEQLGVATLDPETGEMSSEIPLVPPPGMSLGGIRPDGDGYLVALEPADAPSFGSSGWPATRLARLHPDGHFEMLPGHVIDAGDAAHEKRDWPLMQLDEGVGWPDGRLLLAGPASRQPNFLRFISHGWAVLDEQQGEPHGNGDGEVVTVVALPDVGHDTVAFRDLTPADRWELEAAAPTELITIYLNAIDARQYDKAIACVDNRFVPPGDEASVKEYLAKTTAISDVSIRPYKAEDVAGPLPHPDLSPDLHFDVSYTVVDDHNPNGGRTTRFFLVVRDSENGRWLIRGIGTGP
ncbi:MAG: hypothetical protein ACYC5Y_07190, partial [Symbiobacteriia bacterium]